MALTLYYSNEDDRAYGLAGMTISLAALDAIDHVAEVSLDADGPMVDFANDFYFTSSPAISPKAVWNNMLRKYQITTSMVISNVLARSLVRLGEEVPADIMDNIYAEILSEGREECGLDEDEVMNLYRRLLMQNRRIFLNPRLRPAIAEFVGMISRRRRLSGGELRDALALLQL